MFVDTLLGRAKKPWVDISGASKEVQQIERFLVAERDALAKGGAHPERVDGLTCAIMCIRRGDYREC